MKPAKPITINGEIFDNYLTSLSSAPIQKGNDYVTAINITLTPMRYDQDGVLHVPTKSVQAGEEIIEVPDHSHNRVIRYSDIKTEGDIDALTAFAGIESLIQAFINKKGI